MSKPEKRWVAVPPAVPCCYAMGSLHNRCRVPPSFRPKNTSKSTSRLVAASIRGGSVSPASLRSKPAEDVVAKGSLDVVEGFSFYFVPFWLLLCIKNPYLIAATVGVVHGLTLSIYITQTILLSSSCCWKA